MLSEALEKMKNDILNSIDRFDQAVKMESEGYPSNFTSEQEQIISEDLKN